MNNVFKIIIDSNVLSYNIHIPETKKHVYYILECAVCSGNEIIDYWGIGRVSDHNVNIDKTIDVLDRNITFVIYFLHLKTQPIITVNGLLLK